MPEATTAFSRRRSSDPSFCSSPMPAVIALYAAFTPGAALPSVAMMKSAPAFAFVATW